jgi:pimeloyl-ACP methyl ester carboxylesterase
LAWCFLIVALLAVGAGFLWWPPFDGDFWLELSAFVAGLILCLASAAMAAFKSTRKTVRWIGAIPALLAAGLLMTTLLAWATMLRAGASIESFRTRADRGASHAQSNHLVYVRLESTASVAPFPVVYLAGGPGGSGIITLLGDRQPVFMAMREFGDVIALDQRGTMPWNLPWLMCPTTYDYPLDQPLDPAIDLRLAGAYVQACEKFYRDEGVDLRNFNTLENAEDLEDLRVHLGAEKITLWATSYGTHLAFAYLKLHPDRVHRVILHGIEGPDHTIKLPSDADSMLGEIARRAAADPALQTPDLIGDLRTIIARFDAQPVRVTVTVDDEPTSVVLGGYDIRLHTAERLRSPWSSMALPAIVAEMKRGDFSRYARSAIGARRGQRYSLMTVMMDCASGISAARQERVERELASSLLGNVLNHPFPGICRHVQAPDLGESFRAVHPTNVPTLFISGSLDGRTPPGNTEDVLPFFSGHRHVYVEGAGHGDDLFLASPQILAGMQEFMRGRTVSATRLQVARSFDPVDHHK